VVAGMSTLAEGLNIPCNEPNISRKTTSKGGLSANIGELGLGYNLHM